METTEANMKIKMKKLDNESGAAVLIATILILVVITVMGLGAMNSSTMEVTIASNDQQHKMAFYNADSGIYSVPKLVSRSINVCSG